MRKVYVMILVVVLVFSVFTLASTRKAEAKGVESPIKIGILQDLSGGLAFHGEWGYRGAAAAIKRINESGGIAGRPIEYILEDSATSAGTGLKKFKKLVLKEEVDFVIGPCDTPIDVAITPYAKESNTIYFMGGTALKQTEEGNRYVFRLVNNMRSEMKALAIVAMEKWHTYYAIGADMEWGHSVVKETNKILREKGKKIVSEAYTPAGTTDFIPFLLKIDPKKVDAIVIGLYGADAVALITQAAELGYTRDLVIIGNWGISMGQETKAFGKAADDEAVWFTTIGPMRVEYIPDELKKYEIAFREQIGMTIDGHDVKTGKAGNPMFAWVTYESVYMIKRAIEESGWKSRKDNPAFIKALEGMRFKASYEFPEGDIYMRPEDHQCFHDQSVSKIEDGKWTVIERVPAKDIYYETKVDYTKEKFVTE